MSNFKNLNAKFMEEKLKRGWTLQDFAIYFECSEENFQEHLEKIFYEHAARDMLVRLKKNKKIKKTKKLTKNVSKEGGSTCTEELDISNETTVSDEQCNGSESEKSVSNIFEETLEALKLQREDIQSSLNGLELCHKALVSDRTILRKKIDEHKKTLKELNEKVSICKTDLVNLTSELEEKFSIMQELDEGISRKRDDLSEINAKIEKTKSITILVFNSGDIEIVASFSVEIPEANTETVGKIISNEQADNLTLKQIKAVSKLIVLIQNLEQQDLNYELLFDEIMMEEMFNKIKE